MAYPMLLYQKMHYNHHIYQNLFLLHQDYVVRYEAYFQMQPLVLFFHTKYTALFLCIS